MTRHLEYLEIPFHEILARTAERLPAKVAIVFDDRRITYEEWNRLANQAGHGLRGLGVESGDRVAFYLPNCPEYEIAFFGCARIGAVPTPLNPSYKESEIRHQVTDAGARIIVTHQSLYPMVAALLSATCEVQHVVVVGDEPPAHGLSFGQLLDGQPESVPDADIELDSLAALPYSSGTTGPSKGVMLTQRNLVCNVYQWLASTRTSERDTTLIFLPLYHIYGVALMATAATGGATQVLMERFDLQAVLRLLQQEQVTELFVVPPVMLALARSPDVSAKQFRSLRFAMSAAAPLSNELAKKVAGRLNIRIIQGYGMTETSPLTHMVPLEESRSDEGVGVVAPDTRCRIVDLETGERDLPVGEVGEVIISGPQNMAGYWNAPEETARSIRGDWLYTGDIGREDEEGRLFIVDRKKEMIKCRAWSIAPAELEAILLEHPDVLDCGVTGQPDDEAGEVPRAYVVMRDGSSTDGEQLMAFVAGRVANYKQIRAVEVIGAIPRTPSGKILRRLLKERARANG